MSATRSTSPGRGVLGAVARTGLAMCFLLAVGCKTGATGGATVTPGGAANTPNLGGEPEGAGEGDNVGDLEARLDRLRGDHERLSSDAGGGFGQCEDLCDLAAKICSVKESLCEIADDRPAEESYQALCREAQHECREANDSCIRCAQQNGGGSPP